MATTKLNVEINQEEVMATIEFDYNPGQPLICHPVDNAQEGIPAHVEITEIRGPEGEDLSVYLSDGEITDLGDTILSEQSEPDHEPEPEWDLYSVDWDDCPSDYIF